MDLDKSELLIVAALCLWFGLIVWGASYVADNIAAGLGNVSATITAGNDHVGQ